MQHDNHFVKKNKDVYAIVFLYLVIERLIHLLNVFKIQKNIYFKHLHEHFLLRPVHTAAYVEASTLLPIHFEWGDVTFRRTALWE